MKVTCKRVLSLMIVFIIGSTSTNLYARKRKRSQFVRNKSVYKLAKKNKSQKKKKTNYKVKALIGFKSDVVDGDDKEARVFGLDLNVLGKLNITPYIEGKIDAGLILETGSNKDLGIASDYEPTQSVYLNEATLTWSPLELIDLKAGSLNQKELNSPLLVVGSFPGAFEKIKYKVGSIELYAKASQTIPNNHQLNQRIGKVDEGTPFFMTESVGISYKTSTVLIDAQVGHFRFNDLSSDVALKSREFGNSVGGSGLNSDFLYGFDGYNSSLTMKAKINNDFGLYSTGQLLVNNQSPEKRNQAYLLNGGLSFGSLKVGGQVFENQSDASVGYYNSKYYSHNNRNGYGVEVTKTFWDSKSQIKLNYTQSNLIEKNIFQSDETIISINFTKLYSIF